MSAQGIDARELASTEFTASLAHISVADVLQTIWMGRKHALLVISQGAEVGRLWCADGEIVDAESRRLTGEHAVYRLLAIESGQLRADFQRVQRVRMVHASTQALLLEAARRKDESDRLRARLGGGAAGYGAAPSALWGQTFDSAELDVSRLFDEGSSLERALQESSLGELETLEVIVRLLERGQLEPRDVVRGRQGTRVLELSPGSAPSSSRLAYVKSPPPPPPERRLPNAGWALGALIVAAAVAAMWTLGRGPEPAPPVSFAARPAPAAAAPRATAPSPAPAPSPPPTPSAAAVPRATLTASPARAVAPAVPPEPAQPRTERPAPASVAPASAAPARTAPTRPRELAIDMTGEPVIKVQVIE